MVWSVVTRTHLPHSRVYLGKLALLAAQLVAVSVDVAVELRRRIRLIVALRHALIRV